MTAQDSADKTRVMGTVSVIIPVFNRAVMLERALRSVFAQTHRAAEVIVVDDGSEPSLEFVTRLFHNVHHIWQPNAGVSAARNRGIKAANGEFVAFLDSDDEWLPTKLELQLAMLNSSGLRLCHTEEEWIREGRRVNQMLKHRKGGGDQFERCVELCCISPSSVMIHRSLFEDFGVFDESLPACEDYDLWLRICAFEEVAFVSQPQIRKYGGHSDQLSRRFPAMDRYRLRALDKLLGLPGFPSERKAIVLSSMRKRFRVLWNGAVKHQNRELLAELAAFKGRRGEEVLG